MSFVLIIWLEFWYVLRKIYEKRKKHKTIQGGAGGVGGGGEGGGGEAPLYFFLFSFGFLIFPYEKY